MHMFAAQKISVRCALPTLGYFSVLQLGQELIDFVLWQLQLDFHILPSKTQPSHQQTPNVAPTYSTPSLPSPTAWCSSESLSALAAFFRLRKPGVCAVGLGSAIGALGSLKAPRRVAAQLEPESSEPKNLQVLA